MAMYNCIQFEVRWSRWQYIC